MFRVEVLIPFHIQSTGSDAVPGDVLEVSGELLAKIRAINVNMVWVLERLEDKTDGKAKAAGDAKTAKGRKTNT